MFTRHDQVHEPLHVVTTIFNPVRFRSRWRLYEDFARMVQRSGAKLHTVEVSFGERDNVLEPDDMRNDVPTLRDLPGKYTALRTGHELWLKENAINLGFARLPQDWKYAAWIDADIIFSRGDWANETIHQLQHYPIIQMFTEAADLSPTNTILRVNKGFGYCTVKNIPVDIDYPYYGSQQKGNGHPGYAWAIRRDAFDQLGGLVDYAILGSGDHFMAHALAGRMPPVAKGLGEVGLRWLQHWKDRADLHIKQNIGYMDGLILHNWHGKKVDRKYQDRWQILVDAGFNAERDLVRDYQGLYQLRPDNIMLRDGIRGYFRARNEDSIDV